MQDPLAPNEERIRLHKAMLAYGGTYKLSPGKVVNHIDIEMGWAPTIALNAQRPSEMNNTSIFKTTH